MIRNLRPRDRRGWAVLVSGVLAFAVLDVLALLGSELATGLLIYGAGGLLGAAAALVLTYPLRGRLSSSGYWRLAGIVLGLASVFGVILLGTGLAGIPRFPTAEGGYAGTLIFGAALGVGIGFARRLDVMGETPYARGALAGDGPDLRAIKVAAGAVAALFAASFVLYVLLEFVAAPLIRALAA